MNHRCLRRVTLCALVFAIVAVASASLAQTTTALPANSIWKYDATGTDLGTAWRDSTFADGLWPAGPGALGYGDAYVVTTVPFGPNAGNKYRTTYFRTEFTLTDDPDSVTGLTLRANYDDGVVIYLNGNEITRQSMPVGPITYPTFAFSHEGGSYETHDAAAGIPFLAAGTNYLAAEVHQASISSSDLGFDLEVIYSTAPFQVNRGPYLQVGTPTSVTVRWRTSVGTDSRVRYGTHPDSLNSLVDDVALTTEHEIELTGLDSDTQYYYSVGSIDIEAVGGDTDHRFRTSPTHGVDDPVRIWIIGDSGEANQNARDVRNAYLAHPGSADTDVWLMLGDNAYNTGTDSEYQAGVFDTYPTVLRNTVLWPTRGNHDVLHSGPNNDYYEIFTMPTAAEAGGLASASEAYYSFDFANVHFVCLDSQGSARTPGGAMLTWLASDLAATTQDWIIAYWHHPPYTKGSHDSDNAGDSGGRMRDMRENALPILESGGVDLVLSGHSHSYERSLLIDGHHDVSTTLADSMKIDTGDGSRTGDGEYQKSPGLNANEGAVYAVAGSSSKISGGLLNHPVMITSINVLGSMVVDVSGNELDAVFIDENGTQRDDFAIVKDLGVSVPEIASDTGDGPLVRPNPFRFETQVSYELPRAGRVRLAIHDVTGRRVATLVDRDEATGAHAASWSGRDAAGDAVAPGMYFAVLEFGKEKKIRKIVHVR